MKKLIRHGTLAHAHGLEKADLLIENGRICATGEGLPSDQDTEIIDAQDCYILPGGIDVHTHFQIDVGIARSCDDFFSGTVAAACGGTTTIIDHMGFGPKGCSLHHQLALYHQYAAGKAVIDYSFHGVIQHVDEAILDEMGSMVREEGISSFKLYLTYGYKLEDGDVLRALDRLREENALTAVHPENDAAIRWRKAQLLAAGEKRPIGHALSRPLECEAEAVSRVINLAKLAGNAPLYIVHLSNGLGLNYCRLAKENGQAVWVETCPQYLVLDEDYYYRADGLKYILSPPLRPIAEQQKLWSGLADGSIDCVATDHCTFPYLQRLEMAQNDFSCCPNGLPGVENRMSVLFSEGFMKGRLSLPQVVQVTSTRPAQLFGIWPQKGQLAVGSDADVVIFDPRKKNTIHHVDLHDRADYSPYEDFVCEGKPLMTFSRGVLVAQEGHFVGPKGHGTFLFRKPFDRNIPNILSHTPEQKDH